MPNVYEIFTMVANARHQVSEMVRNAKIKGVRMKPQAIAEAIGMKQAMFYRHLQHDSWQPEHMEKIALLLEPGAELTLTMGGTEGN